MESLLIVGFGGALGSVCRYLVGGYSVRLFGSDFAYGTLFVNTVGAFLMLFFMTLYLERLSLEPEWRLFVAVGFLGGLTTFSSFTYETLAMLRDGEMLKAGLNIGLNNLLTIAAGIGGAYAARNLI